MGMITISLTCLVRVLLRNYVSHSYVFVLSLEDFVGQGSDLYWVPDVALALGPSAKCLYAHSASCYKGLQIPWPSV